MAAATECFVDVAMGFSGKYAYSYLSPGGGAGQEASSADASAAMFDVGAIVDLPLLRTVHRLSPEVPYQFLGFTPEVTCGLGYALSNVGGKVAYKDHAQADPLPRTASINLGVTARFAAESSVVGRLSLVTLSWAAHGEDQLVWRKPNGESGYSSGLRGDIRVFHDFVLGKANPNIVKLDGWEFGLLEALYVRAGYHEDQEGLVFYRTSGFGLRFAGVYKSLVFFSGLSPQPDDLLGHIDFGYDLSRYNAQPNHPVDETLGHFLTVSYR
jgi:hypothetical protein